MDSDWKMMHNDTFFVAYNLLVQKLWPHTFSCMSADVKQSSDTSNFVAPKLARWYILFFCFAVWYAHGACCKLIFSKSYRLVWTQSTFSCSGDPLKTPDPEHENLDCDILWHSDVRTVAESLILNKDLRFIKKTVLENQWIAVDQNLINTFRNWNSREHLNAQLK